MRIAMLLDNDFTSDPRVRNEARALVNHGHKVYLICLRHNKLPKYEVEEGIEIFRLYIPKIIKNILFTTITILPFYYWLWYFWGLKTIKNKQVHAIHAHDLYMVPPAYWIKKRLQIRLVVDLHENFSAAFQEYAWIKKFPHRFLILKDYWKKKEGNFLLFCDAIITLSLHFKSELVKKYPLLSNKQWIEYPNVPDVKQLLSYPIKIKEYEHLKKDFWIFYFGIISHRRGIKTLLDSIELIKEKNIKLLLVGPIDKHEIKYFRPRFDQLATTGRLLYYEWKKIEDLPTLIHYSSVCVSPIKKNEQHESGVANKIFQYMLFGKPLVVSNCIPQLEIIDKTKSGLWFEDGDYYAFAEKINYLYKNPEVCSIMGNNGRNAVIENFNLDKYSHNLAELYKKLIHETEKNHHPG